jgi:predicted small secreted protein
MYGACSDKKQPERFFMKRIALAFFAGLSLLAAAGCNTMEGFGKDVQKTGEKIEDAAARKK